MTVKDSGCHLVIEFSLGLVSQFFHRLFMNKRWVDTACDLWPLPNRVFELETKEDGGAMLVSTREDGSPWEFFYGSSLKEIVLAQIDLMVLEAVQKGECQPVSSFQEKLDCVLREILPQHPPSSGGPIRTGPQTISELGILPSGITIDDFEVCVVGGGTGLAVGLFFSHGLSGQDKPGFRTRFSTDFLQGRDFAVSASVEFLNRFVVQHTEVQSALRQMDQFSEEAYTPDSQNSLATLTAAPPDRLRLSGSGEFHTEDCDVDADWWVLIDPSIQDGILKIRADFDYDASEWDIFTCVAGGLLLGASIGIVMSNWIVAIIGGVLNFPDFSLPEGGGVGSNITSCGDKCYEITFLNPYHPDGRLNFELGGDSVEFRQLEVELLDVTILGDANLRMPPTALGIRDHRRWIYPTAESVCAGGAQEYTAASFTLFNPHSPSEAESLGYEWPVICSIDFPPKVPGHSALTDFAEIVLVGPQTPAGAPDCARRAAPPFCVHGLHPRRVEVRVRQGTVPVNMGSSVIIRTNTPPFTRHMPIVVDTTTGYGPIEVDPLTLEFEQRDQEMLDLRNIRRRRMCAESAPPAARIVSVGASFKIRNAGGGTLHICDLALSGPNAAVFEIKHPTTFALLPFTETHVPVMLNDRAQVNQPYTATISVMSMDRNNPQVDVTVRATALDPPHGMNVGGRLVRVDNFLNSACLELLAEGPRISIDLEKWKEIFTVPAPDQVGSIHIYKVALRDATDKLGLMIKSGEESVINGIAGSVGGDLSLSFPEKQFGTAEIHGLTEGKSARLHVMSYRLDPVSQYGSPSPVNDLWASASIAALATEDELQIISVEEPSKPTLLDSRRGIGFMRLMGRKTELYGLSERGLEAFSIAPKFKHLSSMPLRQPRDLALGSERSLVYVLTQKGIAIFDFDDDSQPSLLHEFELEIPAKQLVAIRSMLYVFGDQTLTMFSLARPWLPRHVGTSDLPGVKAISRWGVYLTAYGPNGTQMFLPTDEGKLAQIADYPAGHWADNMTSGRYFLSLLPEAEGFTVWQIRRRQARATFGSAMQMD